MQETKTHGIPINLEKNNVFKHIIYITLVAVAIITGLKQYLLFHTFVELFSAIIAFMISVIAANTYELNKDNKLIFLGIGFGFVGFFDIIHLLSNEGIRLFDYESHNIATQLWITARYFQSITFFISLTPITKKIKVRKIIISYSAITILTMLSIFHFKDFPVMYIDGQGMTNLKILNEFIICIFIAISIYFTIRGRTHSNQKVSRLLILGLITSLFSELFFTSYIFIDDIYNIIGHTIKLISYYFIYLALVKTSLKEPYTSLVKINNLFTDKNRDLEHAIIKLKNEYILMEKRKAESQRKSEILNAILETSLNGILVIGHDEKVIHYNKTYIKMMNLTIPTTNDISRGMLIYQLMEQLINAEEFLNNVDRIKKSKSAFSQIMYFKDGRVIEASSLPFNDKGVKNGILTIFSDITKRLKIQELEKDIEVKEAIIEKAKEYDELKNIFLSTVAHEFRTPLTVILGIIQLIDDLKDVIGCPNYSNIKNYNSILKQNCYRLIKLTNNLVDINKIDTGYFDIELKNQDIISIIEDIALSVAEYIKSKGITLVFDTDVEEKIMACDSYLLERVMLNLLSNSVKFTETGGKIEVTIRDKEDMIAISVKDNGVGIPKEMTDIIFDRFRQVDTSLNRRSEGSGIGLALVKLIVEQHKGQIHLNTELEVGTEFIIELPVDYVDQCMCENLYITKKTNIERIDIEFSDIYDI